MSATVQKEIDIRFKVYTDNVKKSLRNLEKATNQSMKRMESSTKKVSSAFKYGLVAATGLAATAMYKLAKSGLTYNKAMEDSRAMLEAMVKSTLTYKNASGELVSAMERQEVVNRMVGETFSLIQDILPSTAMEMDGLVQNFALMKPAMDQANVALNDQVEILRLASNAAINFGLDANSLSMGIDDLGRGTWIANSAFGKMMKSLGITKQELQAAGDKAAYLKDKLREAGQMADTMEVATSNLKEAWNVLAGTLTAPFWEPLKNAIKATSHELGVNGPLASKAFSEGFIAFGKSAMSVVSMVLKGVNYLVGAISTAWNGFKAIGIKAMQIYTGIQKAGNTLSKTWDFAFNGYKNATKYDNVMKNLNATSKAWGNEMDKVGQSVQGTMNTVTKLNLSIDNIEDAFQSSSFKAKEYKESQTQLGTAIAGVADATEKGTGARGRANKSIDAAKNKMYELTQAQKDYLKKQKQMKEELMDFTSGIGDTIGEGIGDALLSITDKTVKFKDVMRNTLNSIARQIMQMFVNKKISSFISGLLNGGFGLGGGSSDVSMFATGGIINSPTMVAPNAIAGEAGPEAIMPVTRIGGDLGVKVKQAPVNVNVINNSSSQVDVQQNEDSIEIVIGAIAHQIQRGTGKLGSVLENRYGLNKR